jgi:UrcA family protein
MKPLAKTITHALAALGLAGAAITPAMAGNGQILTVKVNTADIDLGTAQGQKTLDQRVEKAVRHVCRTTDLSTGTRVMSQDALACLAKARTDAKQQVAALIIEQQRGG